MMLVKVNPQHIQRKTFNAWWYDVKLKDFSIAGANIIGRYPEKGLAVNEEVDVTFMIFDGGACITVDGESTALNKGDIFIVPKGSKYMMEPELCKEFSLWMITSPKYTESQHKTITK